MRRVIRALEVHHTLGTSDGPRRVQPGYRTKIIGLGLEREELYRRIDARVDRMMRDGWLDEVSGLHGRGYGPEYSSMSGVGYRELGQCLQDVISLEEAVERIKFRTHRFARSQHTWFRRDDDRISWHPSSLEGFGEDRSRGPQVAGRGVVIDFSGRKTAFATQEHGQA